MRPVAGKWLLKHDVVPDFILCSSALRTRQTCTWVCHALGDKAPTPKLEDGLYAASALRMLAVINHVPDTVNTLMVISHMPGVQDLAMHLASRDSDHDAYMDAATRFPTSGLTVLETEKSWAELDGQDADSPISRSPAPNSRQAARASVPASIATGCILRFTVAVC